tara:strand:+ start:2859 stop:3128 length:270 start_codon:yes stop_codon:yes gene_type:complete
VINLPNKLRQTLIKKLAIGNRPLRIFFFGGAIIAYGFLKLLGFLLGIEVNDNEISLSGSFLIAASIFIGYLISYRFMCFIDASASKYEE